MKTLEQLCKEICEDAALREAYEKAAETDAIESFLTEQGAPANVDAFFDVMMQQANKPIPDGDMAKVVGGASQNWQSPGGTYQRLDVYFRFRKGQPVFAKNSQRGTVWLGQVWDFWAAQRPGDPLWYPRYKVRCVGYSPPSLECWQEELSRA